MGVAVEDTGRTVLCGESGGPAAAPSAEPGDDAAHAYASLTREDGAEGDVLVWQWRWLGRILAFRLPCGVVYIGPHWYCSIFMLSFILGVGGFYCSSAATQRGPWPLLGGIVVTTLSTWTFLRCALANPGVLKAQTSGVPDAEEALDGSCLAGGGSAVASRQRRAALTTGQRCHTCNLVQPRGCSHCDFCQVCIEGFDHHCPWMGKCIGKSNLCAFYTFICVSMSSLAYIFMLTVMAASPTGAPVAGATSAADPTSGRRP